MGNLVYQHVFRPQCFRLAPLDENVTAQRSVTHLTLPVVHLMLSVVLLTLPMRFTIHRDEGKPRPYNTGA
ncbi:MAG: hypothetical protein LBQ66_07155 [Planctomycetaceae bacterium]|nr:hypothetical protein [Planctomycetaceae bacterium]